MCAHLEARNFIVKDERGGRVGKYLDHPKEQHRVQQELSSYSAIQAVLEGDKENPENGNAAAPSVTSGNEDSRNEIHDLAKFATENRADGIRGNDVDDSNEND